MNFILLSVECTCYGMSVGTTGVCMYMCVHVMNVQGDPLLCVSLLHRVQPIDG